MPPLASNASRTSAKIVATFGVITFRRGRVGALPARWFSQRASGSHREAFRFDQRPCKPLAAFGQSCRTMSEIYDYREYPVACEVCNSDT